MLLGLLLGPAAAATAAPPDDRGNSGSGGPEKCIQYSFAFTDGHTDAADDCFRGMDVAGHDGITLHVSCSDTFSTAVEGGTVSDGQSDLQGHVIKPEGWWIIRENGTTCGFPPPPDPDPVCELTVLVRLHGTQTLVDGSTGTVTTTDGTSPEQALDGSTDVGVVPCGDVSAQLTSAPADHTIVTGSDSATITEGRGTLVLTVAPDEPSCTGPLSIEVRHADTGSIVAVAGALATIDGTSRTLDADGTTDGGTFACDTQVGGTLDTAPIGFTTVDGRDTTVVTAGGGTLVFTVRPQTGGGTPICTGPLEVEVVDASGELVPVGGATATVAGGDLPLDADGRTAAGSHLCGATVAGTLDTPPAGFVVVDGEDTTTVPESGAVLTFVVEPEAEVGGVVVERDDPEAAPADEPGDAPAPEPGDEAGAVESDETGTVASLPQTGFSGPWLATTAAALLLLGMVALGLVPPVRSPR